MESSALVNISQYGFSILQIETKTICNMQCKFCSYPLRNDKGKTLSDRNILKIIDSVSTDDKFEYICFSHFNEPLLDSRIYDFIKYTKDKNLPVLVVTNGLLFKSEGVIRRLVESRPDYIKLSLQTLNAEIFQSARGINSSFSEYKRGIFEFLKFAKGSASKVTVDIACNFRSWGRILLGLERGDPSVYDTIDDLRADIKFFLAELCDFDSCFTPHIADIDSYLNAVTSNYFHQQRFDIAENISMKIKPFMFGRKLTEFFPVKKGIGCSNRILGVLASGHVVPCCLAYSDTLAIGNINDDSLKNILEKNIDWLNNKKKNGINLPLVCKRCLGAPTRRGAVVRRFRNTIK